MDCPSNLDPHVRILYGPAFSLVFRLVAFLPRRRWPLESWTHFAPSPQHQVSPAAPATRHASARCARWSRATLAASPRSSARPRLLSPLSQEGISSNQELEQDNLSSAEELEHEDRLSNLPDDILFSILERLQLLEAARIQDGGDIFLFSVQGS